MWIWFAQFLPQIVGQALAAIGAAAGGAHLGAARRLDRLVDRQDDFRHARVGGAACQAIAAARTAHALHQAGPGAGGQKSCSRYDKEISCRVAMSDSDNRLGLRMTGQIDHRHDGINDPWC